MKKQCLMILAVVCLLAASQPAFADVDYSTGGGKECNGGSTSAVVKLPPPGTVIALPCPTSGGPICAQGEVCSCTPVANKADGFDAVNVCRKPVKVD